MSLHKIIKRVIPQDFLWKLSTLNIIIVTSAILLSGLAIYNTACMLMLAMGNLNNMQQEHFNSLLFNYLLIFSSITIITGSFLHYYLTRKIVRPVQELINSTKQIQNGEYPKPIDTVVAGEIGVLTEQFNGLVKQLKTNNTNRSQLVSNLSHELRTPLTNLNGYLKALHDGVIQGDPELYQALLNESKRIKDMVEQIEFLKEWGDFSSYQYTEYEIKNITELIEQCAAMFQFQLERKNISLILDIKDCSLRVNADGIQQVVTNLIDNALNHYEGTAPVYIKGNLQNNFYHVSVSNPGPMIPDKEKNLIFERFYRIDSSRNRQTGGSGLGLAIVKEIIDSHSGEIKVFSENGINTFCFTLPVK